MSSQESVDTDRTVVTTYIPAYQKAEWESHAEELDMSQSEFVRSMVQAGRRGFGARDADTSQSGSDVSQASDVEKPHPQGSNPRGSLRETVLHTLDEDGPHSWDELVDAVIGDIEGELEEAVMTLDEANRIRHRPRDGKYVLIED